MTPRVRAVLAVAVAAAVPLVATPAAQADDAAMKAGVIPALQALAPKEVAVGKAVRKVSRLSRGDTPSAYRKAKRAARRAQPKVRRAMKAAEAFGGLLLGQQPSTARGEKAKRLLLRALAIEKRGYRVLFRSLRAYRRGMTPRANGLLRKAARQVRKAARLGGRGSRILARL